MQRLNPILIVGGLAVLVGGCAGQAGQGGYGGSATASEPSAEQAEQPHRTQDGMEKKSRDAALLRPGESRPGLLHIRREGGNYTLELLLDTSSVNTVYDIELPERRAE